jgi:methionine aminopeptidase type I
MWWSWRKQGRMIQIKTPDEIGLMREAGLVVSRTLQRLRDAVAPGITTADLDRIAEESIRAEGAVPSFKGYRGFPRTICTSINDEVVHGIPSRRRRLRVGDIISIDCGAILEGWHGDSAITVPVGEVSPELHELIRVTEESMWAGLAAIAVSGRLSDISAAVERSIRSAPSGPYGIVDHYGGHGIGTEMHQDPHVLNHGRPGRGPKLVPGMALAIEPMVTMGSAATRELDDGWTVVTLDGSYAAHFEHTVGITEDGPWVLTAEDGGAAKLAEYGVKVPQRA